MAGVIGDDEIEKLYVIGFKLSHALSRVNPMKENCRNAFGMGMFKRSGNKLGYAAGKENKLWLESIDDLLEKEGA